MAPVRSDRGLNMAGGRAETEAEGSEIHPTGRTSNPIGVGWEKGRVQNNV